MKHLVGMPKVQPKTAAAFGDIICEINQALSEFVSFTGASKPAKEFAEDRCNLPE